MKKKCIRLVGPLLFSIVLVNAPLGACGEPSQGFLSWFFQEVADFHQAVVEYVKINGEPVFVGLVDFVRASLTQLQNNNPDLCLQFIDFCVNNVENSFSESMLAELKTLNLVGDDATVNDTVRAIINATVMLNHDNTIAFKPLDQIIREGIAVVITAQLATQFAVQKNQRLQAIK